MSGPTCNNWTPSFVCDRALTTSEEIENGCCSACAGSIDEALKRSLGPTYRRRVAEEAGPDLADDALAAVEAALDEYPDMAF